MMSSCSFASGNSSRNSAEQRHICTRVLAAVPRQLQIFVAALSGAVLRHGVCMSTGI